MKKRMKLPNNFGSIIKLPGRRRKQNYTYQLKNTTIFRSVDGKARCYAYNR